jgi:hypothetical protein
VCKIAGAGAIVLSPSDVWTSNCIAKMAGCTSQRAQLLVSVVWAVRTGPRCREMPSGVVTLRTMRCSDPLSHGPDLTHVLLQLTASGTVEALRASSLSMASYILEA